MIWDPKHKDTKMKNGTWLSKDDQLHGTFFQNKDSLRVVPRPGLKGVRYLHSKAGEKTPTKIGQPIFADIISALTDLGWSEDEMLSAGYDWRRAPLDFIPLGDITEM